MVSGVLRKHCRIFQSTQKDNSASLEFRRQWAESSTTISLVNPIYELSVM